ncbi:hypothetical protein C8R45DRAFT_940195 [Mycena sanguinolenta]|nr:hypothetical protein C8R45DRAFT_940195 [Mycena sanguinolenta]
MSVQLAQFHLVLLRLTWTAGSDEKFLRNTSKAVDSTWKQHESPAVELETTNEIEIVQRRTIRSLNPFDGRLAKIESDRRRRPDRRTSHLKQGFQQSVDLEEI